VIVDEKRVYVNRIISSNFNLRDYCFNSNTYIVNNIIKELRRGAFTAFDANGLWFIKFESTGTTMSSYSKRILGDAIGEIGPIYLKNHVTANDWYGNIAMFINSSSSWLQCGSAPFAFTPAFTNI
jgi:hypothetical protein